jgi:hypothetical protein
MTTNSHSVCPFVEYNIRHEHLTFNFTRLVQEEIAVQKMQIKKGKRKHMQIDLNKLYGWGSEMSNKSASLLRRMILTDHEINPILERDIATGDVRDLVRMARKEYRYQVRQQKLGLRKCVQVNFNALYC